MAYAQAGLAWPLLRRSLAAAEALGPELVPVVAAAVAAAEVLPFQGRIPLAAAEEAVSLLQALAPGVPRPLLWRVFRTQGLETKRLTEPLSSSGALEGADRLGVIGA